MNNNIKNGAIISYVSIFLNIAISFVYTPWMIHKIGVSDYGLYSLIISFVSYFILDFGLDTSITRFIAKYRAEGNLQKVEQMFGLTTKTYLLIDFVIFSSLFVLFFFIEGIFTGLTESEISKMKILYCIAGCFSILNFVLKPINGVMMAFELFVEAKILDMVSKVGTVFFIVIALVLDANVYWLVLINGAITFFVSLIKYLVLRSKTHINIDWKYFDRNEMRILFSFSTWIFIISLAQRFRLSLVNSILGIYGNSTEIAIFSVGMTIEGLIYSIASALNGLFLPKVSRLKNTNDIASINNLLIIVGRVQLFVISYIFISFCIFGKTIINFWIGETFSNVYYIVICLIFVNVISHTQHIALDLVYADNKVKYTGRATFITSFIGLLFSCFVAARWGAVGCAISSGAAMLVYQIWLNIFYNSRMGLDIRSFFYKCHFCILPANIIFAFIVYFVINLINLTDWLELIIIGVIYTSFFVMMNYIFIMNKREQQMISAPLLRLVKNI